MGLKQLLEYIQTKGYTKFRMLEFGFLLTNNNERWWRVPF